MPSSADSSSAEPTEPSAKLKAMGWFLLKVWLIVITIACFAFMKRIVANV